MIQDIAPHVFHNEYRNTRPQVSDLFLTFTGSGVLARKEGTTVTLPTFDLLGEDAQRAMEEAIYLFAADETPLYLVRNLENAPEGFDFFDIHKLYDADVKWIPLAIATGHHLNVWYGDNKFCGRCGAPMEHHPAIRALRCRCGNLQFPKIAPVILAAIVDGDRIVATRYKGRPYKGYALNAGFVEIGESLEGAIRREVEEEVGLKVGKIHYFGSQPWGQTGIVMAGYFVEIEGSDEITMDENELSEALWIKRSDMPPQTNPMSLTARMFEAFRLREVTF